MGNHNNTLIEVAELAIPRSSGLISRVWSLTNNKKDKLERYQINFFRKQPRDPAKNSNFNLAFYKYAPDIRLSELSERKRLWLKGLTENWEFDENELPDGHIYRQLKSSDNLDEIKKQLKELLQMEPEVFDLKTAQPLIIGPGEPSPYETGITLDFLTGLPIIPGSALKGITRRAAIMKLSNRTDILPYGEEFDEIAKEYNKHDQIIEVFGTEDQRGEVIFMDAYPFEWPEGLFRVDIMNPHYGPYYESKGNEPPSDWYNPVPVPYLTVNTGVTYRFVLASRDEKLLEKAREWLDFALQNIGIGAKGNQGYGVFK